MPPSATLRIKIPIEKPDTVEKNTPFSYVPAYINDLRVGICVYTYIDKMYLDYKITMPPYSFTRGPGDSSTFMFRCVEDPIKMVGLLTAGSNYIKVFDDTTCIFVPLFKRVYDY